MAANRSGSPPDISRRAPHQPTPHSRRVQTSWCWPRSPPHHHRHELVLEHDRCRCPLREASLSAGLRSFPVSRARHSGRAGSSSGATRRPFPTRFRPYQRIRPPAGRLARIIRPRAVGGEEGRRRQGHVGGPRGGVARTGRACARCDRRPGAVRRGAGDTGGARSPTFPAGA
jgi:hypothetical protein